MRIIILPLIIRNAGILLLATFIISGASSCKKDSGGISSVAADTLQQQDAANAITEAVTPQSSGMVVQVSGATAKVASNAYPCEVAFDSSINAASATGAAVTYSSSLLWYWKLTCNDPMNFSAGFAGNISYNAPSISSVDSCVGAYTVTGLESTSSAYTFNGTYSRIGTAQSEILNKNAFTSTINISTTNIQVNKTTQLITSGTALVTMSGTVTSGKSFSYSGTITFNGGQTATLIITGGQTFQLSWQ